MRRIISALVACLLITGCAAAAETALTLLEPVGVQLDFAPVERGEMYQLTLYEGEVGCAVEELSFPVTGEILSVNVMYGDEVKKGDVLATLDESDTIKSMESLERKLAYLEKNDEYEDRLAEMDIRMAETALRAIDDPALAREKKAEIEDMRIALRQQRELNQVDVEATRAELASVQAKLGFNEIVAPFDGQVVYLPDVQPGDAVQAYTTLVCLADRTQPKVVTDYISEVTMNGAHEAYALIGDGRYSVQMIPPDLSANVTKSLMGVKLTSEFVIESDEAAQVGNYAAVCLVTRYVEDALSIPVNALYSDSQGKYVYKMRDGARVRQNVVTGVTTELRVQITEGLEEGDSVYVKE